VDGRKVYEQYRQSEYKPKHRSPFNISWLDHLRVGDFVIDYTLRSTTKAYAHRDMCLFFDQQDSDHFYYVHLGARSDAHSNSIMIVNGQPRVTLIRAAETNWTEGWHRVRLVRRADAGTIEVYFDDFSKPHMYAIDKVFPSGRVGIGSFDDTGCWRDVKIYANVLP
jgi:hypothetical protein